MEKDRVENWREQLRRAMLTNQSLQNTFVDDIESFRKAFLVNKHDLNFVRKIHPGTITNGFLGLVVEDMEYAIEVIQAEFFSKSTSQNELINSVYALGADLVTTIQTGSILINKCTDWIDEGKILSNEIMKPEHEFFDLKYGEFFCLLVHNYNGFIDLCRFHLTSIHVYCPHLLASFEQLQIDYDRTYFKQKEIKERELPEIVLKTQKEQIRLLYDLGVLNFLIENYPKSLKGNNSKLSYLIKAILKLPFTSIQPTINALMTDSATNKNYPKVTAKTKAIIAELNANESI